MAPNSTIYINGRFLAQPHITGVERFALEIVRGIDAYLATLPADQRRDVCLLAPAGVDASTLNLRYIRFCSGGVGQGHLWQQVSLPFMARDGVVISLCNSGPLFKKKALTVIHDALIYRHPEYFSKQYYWLHSVMGRQLAAHSHLATVSQFSQGELAQIFKLATEAIPVFPNGNEHITALVPDTSVIARLGLKARGYFLFIGSQAPQKNLRTALEAYEALDDTRAPFVIVGASKTRAFGDGITAIPNGVIIAGRLSDENIAALYLNAQAFVFPSLYEGFGIPPLEAMVLGCPVIAADIPACREVCSGAALYFDPHDASTLTQRLRDISDETLQASLTDKGRIRAAGFHWLTSAIKLFEHARSLAA